MEAMQVEVSVYTTESEKQSLISHFVRENIDRLYRSLCVYVSKANLATGAQIESEARELMNEVVARALRSASRFDPSRQVMGWLLGIAANIILQEKHRRALNQRREPFLQDLVHSPAPLSVDEMLAQLHHEPVESIEDLFSSREEYKHILGFVSEEEQRLLHMAVIQQYTAKEIAEQLNCSAGAARVRLFRALKRLRKALEERESDDLTS